MLKETRWVNCEACGGSGEIIRREPGARDPSDEYNELCAVCEGTGRDCVEVSPVETQPCKHCGTVPNESSPNVCAAKAEADRCAWNGKLPAELPPAPKPAN